MERFFSFHLRLFEDSGRTNLFVTSDLEEAIFLADRLIILTNRPTRFKKVMEIEFPRPRKIHVLSSKHFLALRLEALEALHEEALKAFVRFDKRLRLRGSVQQARGPNAAGFRRLIG
jgi:ABC-type nitrate/sulfonate/bicarbonate transport system ATPase subunit